MEWQPPNWWMYSPVNLVNSQGYGTEDNQASWEWYCEGGIGGPCMPKWAFNKKDKWPKYFLYVFSLECWKTDLIGSAWTIDWFILDEMVQSAMATGMDHTVYVELPVI